MRHCTIFIYLLSIYTICYCDIKSHSGKIEFDTQMDSQAEMTLNSVGLGIGVSPSANLHVNGNAIISNQVSIGNNIGSSNLNVNGTIGYGFQIVSSDTTIGEYSVIFADSSSDNITLTLPYAGNLNGRQIHIKKTSTENAVWISGGGNLIDDTSPIELPESSDLASVKLMSNGSQWHKLSEDSLSETVASENLVGWWKFDETTGVLATDSSEALNHGTLSGTMTFSGNSLSGKINRALSFDGSSNNYIDSGNANSFNNWNGFTISAWVKPLGASDGAYSAIMGTGLSGANAFGVYSNKTPDSITMRIGGGGSQATSAISLTLGQWTFITAKWDGTTISIHINGSPSGSTDSWTGVVNASTSSLQIGRIFDRPTYYWNGHMDDVRVYNKALTQTEIQAIYDQGQ